MNASYPELDALTFNEYDKVTYQEPKFFGTGSRNGLYTPSKADLLTDFVTDMSDVKIKINNEDVTSDQVEDVEKYVNKTYTKGKFVERYGDYFHRNNGLVTYEKDNESNRNLLVLKDSYFNNCDRFYAFSFEKVFAVDSENFEGSLQELIEANNITDVLFVQNDMRYYDGTNPDVLSKLLNS